MRGKKEKRALCITITSFFMKCIGLWVTKNPSENRLRMIALTYTIAQILYAIYIEGRDLFYTWGDFVESTYIGVNLFSLLMALFKVLVLVLQKDEFLKLISYTESKFWHNNYDSRETEILDDCGRTCNFFICCFAFCTQCTLGGYLITAIIANIGKEESERVFIFKTWIDLPLEYSPYFEIIFISQTLCLYHIGLCYFCVDNCMCVFNIYTAGQFRILQYRFATLHSERSSSGNRDLTSTVFASGGSDKYVEEFKNCIRQHQDLISYCKKLELVFSKIALGQVLVFSLLLCFIGYQVTLEDAPIARRIVFTIYVCGGLNQLMMFTYSCGDLIHQSENVSNATYASPWPSLSMDESGTTLRKDLVLAIARAQRPCCLTAWGFFPVSLETYTAVLSTAASYFTLLRQRSVNWCN